MRFSVVFFLLFALLSCEHPAKVDIGELVEALNALDADSSAEDEDDLAADDLTDLSAEAEAKADADLSAEAEAEAEVDTTDAVTDDDTNECTNDDTRTLTDVCGLNGNGDQPQICSGGAWADDGACVDPDVCVNETWETQTGVVSECVSGQWVVRRITKQWGTSVADYGMSVVADALGNIYVSGSTAGDLDDNTNAGGICDSNPCYDIFLTKWTPDGTKAWTKQWGTEASENVSSVAVDTAGNIFVTGGTSGNLDGNTNAGSGDIFLTKWGADGTKAWTKQWGTEGSENGNSVTVDSSGNIFVAGGTEGSLDGNTNAGGDCGGPCADIFLTKWNADGTKAWTKQWSGDWDSNDKGQVVIVDANGDIFVFGITGPGLSGKMVLNKWSSDGTFGWTNQSSSIMNSASSAIMDESGNFYVSGVTYNGGDQSACGLGTCPDAALAKFDNMGEELWFKQWGAKDKRDWGNSVAIDGDGNIITTGVIDCDYGYKNGDMFLMKWHPDGTEEWAEQWGASGVDYGNSVALDNSGRIVVAGSTNGSLDGNASAGGVDIFLTTWLVE